MPLHKLLLPFAAAYFLSYFFRSANAVIGPELARDLGLSAGDLGLLTSTYLLAFCLAQLPLGMLLDRFGARRVESALLLAAATGAALFALAEGMTGLAGARALIGLGVSACLMAAFKAFSQCYPPERQASLTGWMMTAGAWVRWRQRRRWNGCCTLRAGVKFSGCSPWPRSRPPPGCSSAFRKTPPPCMPAKAWPHNGAAYGRSSPARISGASPRSA